MTRLGELLRACLPRWQRHIAPSETPDHIQIAKLLGHQWIGEKEAMSKPTAAGEPQPHPAARFKSARPRLVHRFPDDAGNKDVA